MFNWHNRSRSGEGSRQPRRNTIQLEIPFQRRGSEAASVGSDQTAESSHIEESSATGELVTYQSLVGSMTYDSAKFILHGSTAVTAAFPPLQTAVNSLLAFVERMDRTAMVDENLAGLVVRIDQISTVFRSAKLGYLSSTDELQRWAADLAKRINIYRETIIMRRKRPVFARFGTVEDDEKHAVKIQNDLAGVFQDFMMTTTGSIASTMERLLHEHSYARLRTASGAGYKAQRVQGCVGNTRDGLLNEVKDWAAESDGPPILWLHGAPLVGKTCVAYTLCQHLDQQHVLGGSFFCSRSSKHRQDIGRVLPTLAHSLACSATDLAAQMQRNYRRSPSCFAESDHSVLHSLAHARFRYASGLATAVQGNLDATHFVLTYQFRTFLSEPASLAFVEPTLPPCIFVIDAIDELQDTMSSVDQLIESIATFAKPAGLKFVVTSRFDQHMHETILAPCEQKTDLRMVNVGESADIIDTRTKLVQLSGSSVAENSWPPVEEVRILARHAYSQPIFGSIAFRYLEQHASDLPDHLRAVTWTMRTSSDLAILHGLFDLVLRDNLAYLCMNGHPPPAFHTVLPHRITTHLSPTDWDNLTSCLQSEFLFDPSEANTSMGSHEVSEINRAYDEQLTDYLNNSPTAVCNAWRTRSQNIHLYVLRCCLEVMQRSLRFNVSGARNSYLSNEEQNLQANIPGHVAYACAAWIEHAVLAAPQEDVFDRAIQVLCPNFLFWLEVVSVVKGVDAASVLLQQFHCFCVQHSADTIPAASVRSLAILTQQARQFILRTRDAIRVSAPHIYLSALCADPLGYGRGRDLRRAYENILNVDSQCHSAMLPLLEMQGHTGSIKSVTFSPDGQRLASASNDNTIRLWDAQTGTQLTQRFQGHTGQVSCVTFSPDGQRLASASSDQTVRLWYTKTGTQIGKPFQSHPTPVTYITFSPDGQRLAYALEDKTIRLCSVETGAQILHPLQGHTERITSVAFSPDGQRFASASEDKTICFWNAQTGAQARKPIQGHTGIVYSVTYSQDGQHIASASGDKMVRLWNAWTGLQIAQPLLGHTGSVYSVSFSPDGLSLASASADKTIRLWGTQTGAQIGQALRGHTDAVYSVAFSPDGERLASASEDMTIRLWHRPNTTEVGQRPHGHTEWVGSVVFSPDGQKLASASWDRTVRLWDARTGAQIQQPFQGHTDTVYCVTYSPDGQRIASSSADKTVRVWDAETGKQMGQPLRNHQRAVYSVTFSPHGKRLASASADRTIFRWDVRTRAMIGLPLDGHDNSVYSVAFSPDGERLASASWDNTLRLWDARTGSLIGRPLEGHTGSVYSVAFSPDGRWLASGSLDKTIRLWDARTGSQFGQPLRGHTSELCSVVFSPDGQRLASSSGDHTIRLWDALTGAQIGQPLRGHTEWVKSVAFSPDGQRLASASWDKTIRLWDVRTGAENIQSPQNTTSSENQPLGRMAFSPFPKHYGSLGALLPSNPSLDDPRDIFRMDDNGWIRGPQDELVVWILPEYRRGLWWSRTQAIIGEHPVYLDLSRFVHGEHWTHCYTGLPDNTSGSDTNPLPEAQPIE